MPDLFHLRYGPQIVGDIIDPFEHQGTWFGSFRPSFEERRSPIAERVGEFIGFSKQWIACVETGEAADPAAFDLFNDLLSSGLWATEDEDGNVCVVDRAPVFCGDEISWCYATLQ